MRNLDAMEHDIAGWIHSEDPRAFPEIVRHFGDRVFQLAYRMTGSVHDAEDVRQEALLRMHRSLGGFDGRSSLSTWVYRLTLNACHDYGRKQRSTARVERVAAVAALGSHSASVGDTSWVDRGDIGAAVSIALDKLTVSTREALVMRHYLALTFPEIAEIVGEPVTTIKSRVLAGLQQVRDLLEDQGRTTQTE